MVYWDSVREKSSIGWCHVGVMVLVHANSPEEARRKISRMFCMRDTVTVWNYGKTPLVGFPTEEAAIENAQEFFFTKEYCEVIREGVPRHRKVA